jgi:hypothetical protein
METYIIEPNIKSDFNQSGKYFMLWDFTGEINVAKLEEELLKLLLAFLLQILLDGSKMDLQVPINKI